MNAFISKFQAECPRCKSQNMAIKRVERTEDKKNIKTYICGNKECNHEFQIKDEIQGIKIVRTYL